MKISLPLFTGFCALVLFAPLPAGAQSLNNAVRVEAQIVTKRERDPIKGSSGAKITQLFALQVTLKGQPKSVETRTGTWMLFGRDLATKTVTKLDSGTFKVDLSESRMQRIETPETATTATPAYNTVTGGGQGNAKVKRVKAEGVKYYGYSVVIKDGDAVVGELYSEPSLKKESE
jgi:hypothetical protein